MKHAYITCDRCNNRLEGATAAVFQLMTYNARGETERTRQFDLCQDCSLKVIELVTRPPPQPFPLT